MRIPASVFLLVLLNPFSLPASTDLTPESCRTIYEILAGLQDSVNKVAPNSPLSEAVDKLLKDFPAFTTNINRSLPIENFTDTAKTSELPTEVFQPKVTSLSSEVGDFLTALRTKKGVADYSLDTREKIRQIFATPESDGILLTKLATLDEVRPDLVEASLKSLQLRSEVELARIRQGDRRVDIVVLGAGLVDQHINNYFQQMADGAFEILTIEKESTVGSTFERAGKMVILNSTTRAPDTTNLRQLPSGLAKGSAGGDLSLLPGGPVQVNAFERRKNPLAESLAQAMIINRALASGNIALGTEWTAVELEDDINASNFGKYPYRILLAGGEIVRARVVIASGLGTPKFLDRPGLQSAYESIRQNTPPTQGAGNAPRKVILFEDLETWVKESPNPLLPFSGKSVAVLGDGDSGRSAVRWLLGQADPGAYGTDYRNLPSIEKIYWYGQECKTCADYIQKNRAFYADIGRGFVDQTIVALPKADGLIQDGEAGIKVYTGTSARKSQSVDYVIICLGYQSILKERLRLPTVKTPTGDKVPFQYVLAYEPLLGREVPIALQAGNENIFIAGAAAASVVTQEELGDAETGRLVAQNDVSNGNHNWRVWLLAKAIGRQLKNNPTRNLEYNNSATKAPTVNPGANFNTEKGDLQSGLFVASALKYAFFRKSATRGQRIIVSILPRNLQSESSKDAFEIDFITRPSWEELMRKTIDDNSELRESIKNLFYYEGIRQNEVRFEYSAREGRVVVIRRDGFRTAEIVTD